MDDDGDDVVVLVALAVAAADIVELGDGELV